MPEPDTTTTPAPETSTGDLLIAPALTPTSKVSFPLAAAETSHANLRAAFGDDVVLSDMMGHITDEAVYATARVSTDDPGAAATLIMHSPFIGGVRFDVLRTPNPQEGDFLNGWTINLSFPMIPAAAASDAPPTDPDVQFGFLVVGNSVKLLGITGPTGDRASELAAFGLNFSQWSPEAAKILVGTLADVATQLAGGEVTFKEAVINAIASTAIDVAEAIAKS